MVHSFALPDLGEGIAEGQLLEWLVEVGQEVEADDPIAEVSTDKVDVVLPSPVAGVIAALRVTPGSVVPVGTVLAEIETTAGGAAPSPRQAAPTTTRSRTALARRFTEAAATPTVTNVEEVEFEAVMAVGERPLVAVARAAVLALGEHPALNAWGEADGSSHRHGPVHLGIATQTPEGLVVPVVRDAERLTTEGLARAIKTVTTDACEGRPAPSTLGGSTFTITSAGRLSGIFATPLLNLPEVAILGLYRVEPRAVVRDGSVVVRNTGHLSVTFDHRAVDGVDAARFLAGVRELLETWPAARDRAVPLRVA